MFLTLNKDEPVRLLSDAYLLATEEDPETRDALVEESKKTGKSVRSIVQARHKASKTAPPPEDLNAGDSIETPVEPGSEANPLEVCTETPKPEPQPRTIL